MGPVAFLVNKQLLRHTWRISDKSTKGGEVSGMSVPLSTWAPQGAKWWKKGRQMSIGYTRYVLCTYTHMIYTYMYGASGYICIRRPRQTQGGARQGIRHFPLVASGSSSVRHFYIYIYPPTPADARGSAPGNNTFGCLCTPCSISTAQQQEGHVWHSFSTVSDDMDDMLGSFWATFCRCSVLHCHCVSLSGRAAFAALAALGSSINSSQAPVHHAASAQHSSRKAMFDTVLLRF